MSKVRKEITVQAPVATVYEVWHNFENFPRFMDNIEEVRVVGDNRSHWKAKGPLGRDAEWDAEITMDDNNQAIGWRSIEGSSIKTAGRVNFAGMGDTTKLDVVIEYDAPAGPVGDIVTKIFANPDRQVEGDLNRFKEAVEKGRDASGFTYSHGAPAGDNMHGPGVTSNDALRPGETLGGSLGPVTATDLQSIDKMNGGSTQPMGVDDPATRN